MPKRTRKLNILKAITDGLTTPHKNPSMFLISVVYSSFYSLFMFFTVAFYQPGEEPELMQSVTGILAWAEYWIFLFLIMLVGLFIYSMLTKMAYDSLSGKPDIAESMSLSLRKFIPLLAGSIVYTLIV